MVHVALALVFMTAPVVADEDAALPDLVWLDPPRAVSDGQFLTAGDELATMEMFEGRAVVLNFWATWCPPCIEEMPSLDRLSAGYGGDDLVVVTMSVDRGGEQQIADFYERLDLRHLGMYRDPRMHFSRSLRVFGLPTTLLIDHEGRILAHLVGDAEWDGEAALAVILPLADAARRARLDPVEQASAD